MLYQPEHIPLIQQGIKIETRRQWKEYDKRGKKRPVPQIGSFQPIMRDYRHKHNSDDGYILVQKVYKQKLGDMTEIDAYNEGGYTLSEYKSVWVKINGSYDPNEIVFVVRFQYKSIR